MSSPTFPAVPHTFGYTRPRPFFFDSILSPTVAPTPFPHLDKPTTPTKPHPIIVADYDDFTATISVDDLDVVLRAASDEEVDVVRLILSPKRARKIAKALKRAAAHIESTS